MPLSRLELVQVLHDAYGNASTPGHVGLQPPGPCGPIVADWYKRCQPDPVIMLTVIAFLLADVGGLADGLNPIEQATGSALKKRLTEIAKADAAFPGSHACPYCGDRHTGTCPSEQRAKSEKTD